MQEAEKPAAKSKAERCRGFHLEREGSVVEAQPAHRCTQILEIRSIHRKQAAEHHRLCRLETWKRLRCRSPVLGNGVADPGVGDFLDRRRNETELAGSELVDNQHLWGE